MTDEKYDKILKQYHKFSDRHILVAETDMSYPDIQRTPRSCLWEQSEYWYRLRNPSGNR